MKYNFVFFDGCNEYKTIARNDLLRISDQCNIRNEYIDSSNRILSVLFKLHTSPRINHFVNLPFKWIWNKKYIGTLSFDEPKPICFLFSMDMVRCFGMKTFAYLRKHYPDCKIVLMERDKVQLTLKENYIDLDNLKKIFDSIYTIDINDSQKYGFKLVEVMCSRYPVVPSSDKTDVVFVGRAKDRLDRINKIYRRLTGWGLKCNFVVISDTNVPVEKGIKVTEKVISYAEMLKMTVNSKCILELTQKDIQSPSSRYLEALCYNKKLITDVKMIKDLKYYDSNYIRIIDSEDDIDLDFIKNDCVVDYHYDDYYSPINLLKKIDSDL